VNGSGATNAHKGFDQGSWKPALGNRVAHKRIEGLFQRFRQAGKTERLPLLRTHCSRIARHHRGRDTPAPDAIEAGPYDGGESHIRISDGICRPVFDVERPGRVAPPDRGSGTQTQRSFAVPIPEPGIGRAPVVRLETQIGEDTSPNTVQLASFSARRCRANRLRRAIGNSKRGLTEPY